MNDTIYRQDAIEVADAVWSITGDKNVAKVWDQIKNLPSAQPEYEELTPAEAASEIASETLMSVWYWLDDLIRLKQMGYAICRKR